MCKLLPDDATDGEIIAAAYFIEEGDFEVVEAWGAVCRTPDKRERFAKQLDELGKRLGRPVSHIEGIHHALRFWSLAMNDPKLFCIWRQKCFDYAAKYENCDEIGGLTVALLLWSYADSDEAMLMRLADFQLQPLRPRRHAGNTPARSIP